MRYAVERRIAAGRSDYGDHASRIELAALTQDEGWALATISDARERRGEKLDWALEIENALKQKAGIATTVTT